MTISKKNVGAFGVHFQWPLSFRVHANETTPVSVSFLIQIPIAVSNGNHVGGNSD